MHEGNLMMIKEIKYKKPICKEEFEKKTPLLLDVVAETIIADFEFVYKTKLIPEQRQFFINHFDERIRWLYTNNQRWKRTLNNKTNAGRDHCYIFAYHWLMAYMIDNEQYVERTNISYE